MMNVVWVAIIVGAILYGSLNGTLNEVATASTRSATDAINVAIGLVGTMTLFLGLMQVLHAGGLLRAVSRALRPVMSWLFPGVPADHPAMGMMILNMTANMLGLGPAATPFGLKAMIELEKLNDRKGTASDAMALFLAINTSNVALIPSGVIGLRAALGSTAPGSIFLTTLIATSCSTVVAIIAAKSLQRLRVFALPEVSAAGAATAPAAAPDTSAAEATVAAEGSRATPLGRAIAWVLIVAVGAALVFALYDRSLVEREGEPLGVFGSVKDALYHWPLVGIIALIVLYGVWRGVRIYDVTVEAGKEGFQIGVRIMPYLVVILAAIGMLNASGGLDSLVSALSPITDAIGMPAETVPMALMRPLSGNGAFGVAAATMKLHGPDSLIGQIVSTMQGSCETTFYVLALYFGVIGIRVTRHTLLACLIGDAAGLIAAVWTCRLLLG